MPRGDKSKYTDKQKREAEHIEEGYEKHGVDDRTAERIAWATVNKESGGGKKSGSGRGKVKSNVSSKRGGKNSHKSTSVVRSRTAAKKVNARTASKTESGRASAKTGSSHTSSKNGKK